MRKRPSESAVAEYSGWEARPPARNRITRAPGIPRPVAVLTMVPSTDCARAAAASRRMHATLRICQQDARARAVVTLEVGNSGEANHLLLEVKIGSAPK